MIENHKKYFDEFDSLYNENPQFPSKNSLKRECCRNS